MTSFELFQRLSVALAIGLLIGLERGWKNRDEEEGGRAAGVRTITLGGLLGGVWGVVAQVANGVGGGMALGLAFATYSAVIAAFRWRENMNDGTFGATTVVAAMLAFALGAFAGTGNIEAAAAGGVAAAALLAWKSLLHSWLQKLTKQELRSGLILLAMTFILLPLLPQQPIDPWDAVNPFQIWLMTIMIAFISFVGYIAVKLAGERNGVAITGIAGGLASSTAVTLTLSKVARENEDQHTLLAAGVLFASAVMAGRVLAVVGVVNAGLLPAIALPIGTIGAVLALGALFLIWRNASDGDDEGQAIEFVNPFELSTVLKFGAILTTVMLATKLLTGAVGAAGAYIVAAISGIADVDAITLSMARGAGGDASTAVLAIFIAVTVNTIVKTIMAWWIGGAGLGRWLAIFSALAIAGGGAAFLVGSAWMS